MKRTNKFISLNIIKLMVLSLLFTFVVSQEINAQKCKYYKDKFSVDNTTGKSCKITKRVVATEIGMLKPAYYIAFASCEEYYAVHLTYMATDKSLICLKGDSVRFQFIDGQVINLQVYANDHFGAANASPYFCDFQPNCFVTKEQLKVFASVPLATITWFPRKPFNAQSAFVPKNKQEDIAYGANCILYDNCNDDEVSDLFSEANDKKHIIPIGSWDY